MALDWLEAGRAVHGADSSHTGLSIYPRTGTGTIERGMSRIVFEPVEREFMGLWLANDDPAVTRRVAPFVRTGFDGSRAGIWLDDNGRQHFVHLGSGSGSTLVCVLASHAIDFLRLLTIGYEEFCWPWVYDLTEEEAYRREHGDDGRKPGLYPPIEFRNWVRKTFDVPLPKRGSEIVARTAEMDDENSDDPFWQWIDRVRG